MQATTVLALITSITIATLHGLAMSLDLYWRYWWLDIPMHIAGGAMLVLFWATLIDMRFIASTTLQIRTVAVVAIAAMLAWEVFGFILEKGFKDNFIPDTSLDLLSGSIGVMVGYLVVRALYNTKL